MRVRSFRVRSPLLTLASHESLPLTVPVAQLDRASDFGSEGWGFESLQARIDYKELTSILATQEKCVCHLRATFSAKG